MKMKFALIPLFLWLCIMQDILAQNMNMKNINNTTDTYSM